jgi:hypothetical protein
MRRVLIILFLFIRRLKAVISVKISRKRLKRRRVLKILSLFRVGREKVKMITFTQK